jgi:RNA polymerase sigma factor (sigma-70 family)
MVARVAKDVGRMFARHIDVRDLASAGAIGLVKAADAYDPGAGEFERYAYFRVRGAIIDSQKRRTYREETHVSLNAMRSERDGWIPARLDTDGAALADAAAEQAELKRRLARAVAALPAIERHVLVAHLAGEPLARTARSLGRGLTWTRQKLARARMLVGRAVREGR